MQLLGAAAIEALLPMSPCIDVVAGAMRAISCGEVLSPLRSIMALQSPNAMGIMPGAMPAHGCFGVKVLALYPGNGAKGLPSHAGMVLLFDAATGAPVAVLESHSLTALRTAAASAVATRALARPGSSVLALLGTGHQALWHVRALREVMPLRRLQLWNHQPRRCAAAAWRNWVSWTASRSSSPSRRSEALEGADVVCTVSAAQRAHPARRLAGGRASMSTWSVPASPARARRTTTWCCAAASLSTRAPARRCRPANGCTRSPPASCRTTICGARSAKCCSVMWPDAIHKDDITVYKSLGHTAQDLATADAVVRMARASGQYPELPW